MEDDGDGVICGSVGPVGKVMLIQARWDVGLDMLQHQSLHAFCDYRCQGHRLVVIQSCDGRGLGLGDYDGSFQAGWDFGLLQRAVKDGGKYCGKLVSA